MNKLSKELDEMLNEFGMEEDKRLKNISNKEFEESLKQASKNLQKEFEDIAYRRAKAFHNFIKGM